MNVRAFVTIVGLGNEERLQRCVNITLPETADGTMSA